MSDLLTPLVVIPQQFEQLAIGKAVAETLGDGGGSPTGAEVIQSLLARNHRRPRPDLARQRLRTPYPMS
jgi:hypothetical protein